MPGFAAPNIPTQSTMTLFMTFFLSKETSTQNSLFGGLPLVSSL
jgi:hypothetical protein